MTSGMQKTRLFFIDNLRVLLIVLVIAFHAGAPYAGVPWYTIPSETTELSEFVLGWLLTVWVAFFLGLFFMISGYFTPGSYDRKGSATFLKDRFLRVGVPFGFFVLVVMPSFSYFLHWLDSPGTLSYWQFLVSEYYWETHHLWFLVNLLFFAGLYVVWRGIANPLKKLNPPGNVSIFLFVLLLAVVTFVVRIWYPVGVWDPFKLVEPAYLPHFCGLFAVGVAAYRSNWIYKVPTRVGVTWLKIGIIAVFLFPVLYVIGERKFVPFIGGAAWRPCVFAFWETFVCVGMCAGLLILFRERVASQEKLGKVLSSNVYAVYLFHLLVVVSLQRALITMELHPLGKFVLVVAAGIPLSFLVSHCIRKLPLAKSIL
ncbi:MAG: hypothetical protein AYK18_01370 [Theionarchaea archaeon DG-70]|nr:MAG: hypothetical protein AYK18_01370 [Theionarchaea archaeon DG-70]